MEVISKSDFEREIKSKSLTYITNRYLFDNFPYCFKDNPDLYYEFRKNICDNFKIHPKNFCVVGSGKIGFSLNPNNYGRKYCDSSDIDVVLISDELFHELWLKLLAFKKGSVYRLSQYYKKKFEELQKTLFYGIIRIDKLSDDFDFAKEWWTFFNKLSTDETLGMHQIRGAIFKSWQHVSLYYEYSIKKISNIIEANNESNGF